MDATLEAVNRERRGKNEPNLLRAGGRIPAVFYGPGKDGKGPEGVAVAVDPKAVLRILHSDTLEFVNKPSGGTTDLPRILWVGTDGGDLEKLDQIRNK